MNPYRSLSRYLHNLAASTWTHMKDADSFGLPFNEETITEWLMLCLARTYDPSFFLVKAFNKYEEGGAKNPKPTGADLEIWVETPNGQGITLRLQAKRIFWSPKKLSAKYDGIERAKPQTRNLINYSGNAIPLYVFYNWQPDGKNRFPHHSWKCQAPILGTPIWGASLSPAFLFLGQNKPKPAQVPLMMPWGCFFCDCKLPYRETTLAALLGNRFKDMFEQTKRTSEADQIIRDIQFQPFDIRPEWSRFFTEEIIEQGKLREELERRKLDTVIYIKQIREWERRE